MNGVTTLTNWQFLIDHILTVSCLYSGTLTGTWTSPTGTIRARGTLGNATRLNTGFCATQSADVTVTINTTAVIRNP